MKRILTFALCIALLITLLPHAACAEGAGWYVVDSDSPKGYCYLYSAASSRGAVSRNLGRYDNGAYVYVLDYYGGNGYCRVQTQDGKTGYIGAKSLKRYYGDVWSDSAPGWFLVASRDPQGYCYLYSAPSSRSSEGYNKGRHNNGEQVYVLSYYGGNGFCFVRTEKGGNRLHGRRRPHARLRYPGRSHQRLVHGRLHRAQLLLSVFQGQQQGRYQPQPGPL